MSKELSKSSYSSAENVKPSFYIILEINGTITPAANYSIAIPDMIAILSNLYLFIIFNISLHIYLYYLFTV